MAGSSSLVRFFEPALRHYNQGNVQWDFLWMLVIVHVVAIYSLTHLTSTSLYTFMLAIVLYFLTTLGTTAGVHRFWSHQSYKATLPLQIFLMLCYSLSNSGSIHTWVCKHHSHHKYVDTHGDPHNSSRGFFFSHIGWLLLKERSEVVEAKNEVNTARLDRDPVVQFNKNNVYWLDAFMSLAFPSLVCMMWGDGLNGLLVAGFLRLFLSYHAIFCVNSLAHLHGERLYESSFTNLHGLPVHPNACARQNKFVALVAAGEGWHNFHHKYPYDYANAELGAYEQPNLSLLFIDLMVYLGQAWDCRRVSLVLVAKDKAKVISAKSKELQGKAESSPADESSVTQVEEVCSSKQE